MKVWACIVIILFFGVGQLVHSQVIGYMIVFAIVMFFVSAFLQVFGINKR